MTARRSLAAGLLAALAGGCGPRAETGPTGPAAELPTVTVTVAPVTARPVQRAVTAVGTLNGYDDVTLSPKADGRVAATYADVGDVVLPGQPLLDLDPTDAELDLARARRGLELELAKVDLDRLPAGAFDPEAVPAVQRAQVALTAARREWDRVSRLGGLSDRERLGAETDLRAAEAAKRAALSEARAVVAAARLRKAEVDAAEQKVADCRLRAPAPAGWDAWAAAVGPAANPFRYSVALKLIGEGEMARGMAGTPAFRLVIDRALKLPAAVPERYAPEVKVGQPVEVRVDAYPGRAFPGVVHRLSAVVDPQNRTFPAVVAVMNLDGKLLAGGFARATIRTRVDPAVKTVPPAAVVTFAGVTKVFAVAGGKAKAVEVQLETRDRDWVEVAGDLPAGAQVATSGFAQLVDGSPVKVRDGEQSGPTGR